MIVLYRYAKKRRAQRAADANTANLSAPTLNATQEHTIATTKTEPLNVVASPDTAVSSTLVLRPDTELPANAEASAEKARKSEEARAARKYMWKVVLCLWLPFFLSSLDLTVVATALPYIASHFDEFNQLNWAVTAFTLTSTAFIPLFGQLSTTFGRHSALQLAVWSITIGSIICAAAPKWAVLLLGRALQGLGTAGVQNVVMIILSDKVSLKTQARNTSIFQFLAGIGYAVGPVIGGYLTNDNWRYCFILPAGIGALSIISVFLLRKDLVQGTVSISHPTEGQTRIQALTTGLKVIDFGGATLFIASTTLIILATSWGGSTYAWTSAAVIAPLILGALLFLLFALYEFLLSPHNLLSRHLPTTQAMIPTSTLRNKDVTLISIIAASSGAALYSIFYFISIYFILVEGYAASHAGTQLLYYVPGLGIGVYTAIFLINTFPRQTFLPLTTGSIIETTGIALLTYAIKARNSTLVNVTMGIAGAGTGARFMPSNIHLAGLMRHDLAPAYSMLRFSQPFGGTLALTIMGAVFQNKMANSFKTLNLDQTVEQGGGGLNLHNSTLLSTIADLPVSQRDQIRSAGANATMWAFVSVLVFIALSMFCSFALGNVWIEKGEREPTAAAEDGSEGAEGKRRGQDGDGDGAEVDRGLYLLHLFTGRVRVHRESASKVAGAGERKGMGGTMEKESGM